MIRHDVVLRACRAHLASLEAVTTGTTTLAAVADGYTRSAGSFLADGFAVGMQVTPDGFSETTPATITAVTATTMRVNRPRALDTAAGGRALRVVLPDVAYTNVSYTPSVGRPWIWEQYLPNGTSKPVLGPLGTVEGLALYTLAVHVPQMTDATAVYRYADAITRHFAPGTTIPDATHDIRVRSDVSPFPSSVTATDGWAVTTVTIPVRVHVPNAV